ncbi:P-loop containing nucleoside triphosphate hydrolase protein [Aspergillus foveolatus]|uniref:P-loop containing nucleoside triphosphate hydrolase protein n=1 Tax=Aspergillus foveolatus TaxID=210207 RepID=UPI003CCDCCF1
MALGFWYGGTLFGGREYSMFQFFLCFSAVIFGARSAGTIFSYAPDIAKASHAAASLTALFDRTPDIDSWSHGGEMPFLRGLNLHVKAGQYVAFVGASGCGKSTAIALLERFYDLVVGSVYVDDKNILSFNINKYRSHLALTEMTFRTTNWCYAASTQNIISLPNGFDTIVGSKGSMMPGGQKQRLAIARALLRNPRILLLDEATSALDSESEKLVQAALDTVAQSRTTIAVAHRLSTVQKADMIYFSNQGRIIECGTHSELMQKRSTYFELVSLQDLGGM